MAVPPLRSVVLYSEDAMAVDLRCVPLRGQPDRLPYRDAEIRVAELPFGDIRVAQNYLLAQNLADVKHVFRALKSFGVQAQGLRGHARLHFEDATVRDFMLPVVEWSGPDGCWLVCDGAHRLRALLEWLAPGSPVPVVTVRGVDPLMPYYALPGELAVGEIPVLDEPPPSGFAGGRKAYRCAEYRALFRDFNAVFAGVTVAR